MDDLFHNRNDVSVSASKEERRIDLDDNPLDVMQRSINILISGGGTGGHIYPAIAIANEIKVRYPDANILFVGAKDKMEMEKVPKAGYRSRVFGFRIQRN